MEEGEVMTKIFLEEHWQKFQFDRVSKIHEWYQQYYENAPLSDPLIQYIVLWSVFNALYNTYDLPNNKLEEKIRGRYKFRNRLGHMLPIIKVSKDSDRVSKFGSILASSDTFATLLNEDELKRHIGNLVERIPSVIQDEEVDVNQAIPIILQNDKNVWAIEADFTPASIQGIASLDHRLFLTDGYIFFEYAAIDNPWNDDGQFINVEKTTMQLLNGLYQLRNNIVHGGSAAYSNKEIIYEAVPILDAIVKFVFCNSKDFFMGKK